jgi:hypothetical protein
MAKLFNTGAKGPFSQKKGAKGAISIANATLLGYNQDIVYFGSDIGFKKTIGLEIKCAATDIKNLAGVSATAATLLSFLDTSKDYSKVIINGTSMGPAKVISFSSDPGDLVNVATCSMSFLIHETFDDLKALGGFYADYAAAVPGSSTATKFGQILDSFTDSISLTRGNNTTGYNRNISISANKSLSITTLGDTIAQFVRGVLLFGQFYFPDFSGFEADINKLAIADNGYKKFITETRDDVSNTYTFTESLDATNIQNGYSLVITNAYSRDQKGIETVTENGSIQGLKGKTSGERIDAAEIGYTAQLALASARMTEFYEARRQSSDCPPLNTEGSGLLFMTKGKSTNTFDGSMEYTLVANNDPKYKDGDGERWEFTLTVESDGVYEDANMQGSVKGGGYVRYDADKGEGLLAYPMYQEAKKFFEDNVLKTLSDKVRLAINSATFPASDAPTRRTEAHSPWQGVINYSRSFSNNPIYAKNGADEIKKLEATATLGATVPITHEFVSLKPDNERKIIQPQTTKSLSNLTNTITALGYRVDPGAGGAAEMSRIGDIAKDEINLLGDMNGDTVYMNSASFSFSFLNDVLLTLNTSYNKGVGSC